MSMREKKKSLIENANGGMFVSMPRYKSGEPDDNGNAEYRDICNPVTKEAGRSSVMLSLKNTTR